MSALLGLRATTRRQFRPDYPVKVGPGPLTQGLVTLLYPTTANGNSLVDLVTGKTCTLNNAASVTTGSFGRNLDVSSGTATATVNSPIAVTSGQMSVLAVIVPQVLTRGDLVTRWTNGGGAGDQFNLLYGLTSGKPQMYGALGGGATWTSGVGSTAMVVGGLYTIGGTVLGTASVNVFLNGKLEATAVPSSVMNNAPTTALTIGNNANADGHFNGQFLMVGIWNLALDAQAWAQMGTAPWSQLVVKA